MKSIFEQTGGTYTQVGDYLIPNIELSKKSPTPIGKYGRMREAYLKEHRLGLYARLLLSGKLSDHLTEVELTSVEAESFFSPLPPEPRAFGPWTPPGKN